MFIQTKGLKRLTKDVVPSLTAYSYGQDGLCPSGRAA